MSTTPYQHQPSAIIRKNFLREWRQLRFLQASFHSPCVVYSRRFLQSSVVKQADRGEASGRSMAMAGMIMGYISLAIFRLAILAYIAILIIVIIGAAAAQPGGL